ncbi:uncharacterized protein PgNI_03091 [Pyricularia grisea]|uniref:Uncharacterized protein n=1 Tax=Pyricularia grisea TaxID=148305 RepID=A0A6P8B8L7_PYRGI|nr:uncharacterized protein PgNI_03091 [Pyricularia grisea]TLD11992.1 hypothetical protein PgNI_03091 [Pyricularia grisea]
MLSSPEAPGRDRLARTHGLALRGGVSIHSIPHRGCLSANIEFGKSMSALAGYCFDIRYPLLQTTSPPRGEHPEKLGESLAGVQSGTHKRQADSLD